MAKWNYSVSSEEVKESGQKNARSSAAAAGKVLRGLMSRGFTAPVNITVCKA